MSGRLRGVIRYAQLRMISASGANSDKRISI